MWKLIWVGAWLAAGLPHLDFDPFTDWTIALVCAVAVDALAFRPVAS